MFALNTQNKEILLLSPQWLEVILGIEGIWTDALSSEAVLFLPQKASQRSA